MKYFLECNFKNLSVSQNHKHVSPFEVGGVDGYIHLVKNPLSWLVSMDKFLEWRGKRVSPESYRFALNRWCDMSRQCLDWEPEQEKVLLRFEDVYDSHDYVLSIFQDQFGLARESEEVIQPKDRGFTSDGLAFDPSYYTEKAYLNELPLTGDKLRVFLDEKGIRDTVERLYPELYK